MNDRIIPMNPITYRVETASNLQGASAVLDFSHVFYFSIKNTTPNPAQVEIGPIGIKTIDGLETLEFHTGNPMFRFPEKTQLKLVQNATAPTTLEVTTGYVPF